MKIVIVGGGSAGWLTAAMWIKETIGHDITVIESSKIPIIGAGEGSTGSLPWFSRDRWPDNIVNELDFLRKTEIQFDLIYADPARRGSGNQKLYKLQDCEPNVVEGWELMQSKSENILVKVSPMLDLTQAWTELPDIQKITVVSVRNEVKELLLHWEKARKGASRMISVVDLESEMPSFEFEPSAEEQAHSQFAEAGNYLVEPLAGILKAGAFNLFGERYGLKKLERNSHLYTSETFSAGIPGRVFEVKQEINPKKQEIKTLFPSGKVNVICRNYSTGAEELKKKLGLKDGGKNFLIGTKTASGYKLYWCTRVQ
jgi:hypothetical protein